MERILFRFTKGEPVRFVGHLDLMRVFERAFRRSGFPVAYSQGFNPRPRMAFASALTLGATSDWELCQLDLAEDLDEARLETAVAGLREQLPAGLAVHEIWSIPLEKRNPYIQVRAAVYEVTLVADPGEDGDAGAVAGEEGNPLRRLERFFESGARPAPDALEQRSANEVWLRITLPVGERDGVRIRDLVAEVEQAVPGLRAARLHRARLRCEQEPA